MLLYVCNISIQNVIIINVLETDNVSIISFGSIYIYSFVSALILLCSKLQVGTILLFFENARRQFLSNLVFVNLPWILDCYDWIPILCFRYVHLVFLGIQHLWFFRSPVFATTPMCWRCCLYLLQYMIYTSTHSVCWSKLGDSNIICIYFCIKFISLSFNFLTRNKIRTGDTEIITWYTISIPGLPQKAIGVLLTFTAVFMLTWWLTRGFK